MLKKILYILVAIFLLGKAAEFGFAYWFKQEIAAEFEGNKDEYFGAEGFIEYCDGKAECISTVNQYHKECAEKALDEGISEPHEIFLVSIEIGSCIELRSGSRFPYADWKTELQELADDLADIR